MDTTPKFGITHLAVATSEEPDSISGARSVAFCFPGLEILGSVRAKREISTARYPRLRPNAACSGGKGLS